MTVRPTPTERIDTLERLAVLQSARLTQFVDMRRRIDAALNGVKSPDQVCAEIQLMLRSTDRLELPEPGCPLTHPGTACTADCPECCRREGDR